MKLYAQIGHGPGEKLTQGLSEGLLDGAIFSPKDLPPAKMQTKIAEIRGAYPSADILVDPQFYISLYADTPAANIGHVKDWKWFRAYRKGELELSRTVDVVLQQHFEEVSQMDVTGIIAPNIHISQSFDSREAVIAKNFIRQARAAYDKLSDDRPLLASLVVCREALQDRREFEEFINDVTVLESPPDGFYLIVAGRSSEARSDFFHTDVLANWMLLNLSLSINGLLVVNGYSDILSPFLGVVGAHAGATGWWSNLRMFSMDRFFPAGGGRQPIARYLSKLLLNRITFAEKDALASFVPGVVNNLSHDADYNPEPDRTMESLQSWEAIQSLNTDLVAYDLEQGMAKCREAIDLAKQAYAEIAQQEIPLDAKSRDDHLEPLEEALKQLEERAELR